MGKEKNIKKTKKPDDHRTSVVAEAGLVIVACNALTLVKELRPGACERTDQNERSPMTIGLL